MDGMIVCRSSVREAEFAAVLVDELGVSVKGGDNGHIVFSIYAWLRNISSQGDSESILQCIRDGIVEFIQGDAYSLTPLLNFGWDRCILGVLNKGSAGMKKKYFFVFLLFILTVVFLGFGGPLDKDITISLELKQVENLSPLSLKYVFYINITNSSSRTYVLTRYRYRFVVEEKEYLQLYTAPSGGLELKAYGKTMIAIPVKITYEFLFQAIEEVRKKDTASCYLMGELFFGDGRRERGSLPIAFSGEFPIFKIPEVEILSLHANTVSIGGADLDLKVKLVNSNGFDLWVDDVVYNLKLGGYTVDGGRIEGDKDVKKKEEKIFSLHLLINFFDVGKDVYSILQKSEVNVSFSGEIEFRTDWGRMKIPFAEAQKIPLSRAD
jgi:LEA14-like dessication related protein